MKIELSKLIEVFGKRVNELERQAALDRRLELARQAGERQERARIAGIMNLPGARRQPLFAWRRAGR